MQQYPSDFGSRLDRRRDDEARRRRGRRKAAAAAGIILLAVCIGIVGWLGYRFVSSRRKPPPPKTYKIVLPEGLTVDQTAARVEDQSRISADRFKEAVKAGNYNYSFLRGANGNLEGFLFPKTYTVTASTTARKLVTTLLDQFGLETSDLEWSRAHARGQTGYQVIIVASLVEKEAKAPQERPLIASVIYNRLKAGMKLQIDATVQYALGKWKEALSLSDLQVDSPYNTYKISGLPPAPICNPGFESIRAALYQSETSYLYYIVTSPGHHSFTGDYQQFLRWKQAHGKQ